MAGKTKNGQKKNSIQHTINKTKDLSKLTRPPKTGGCSDVLRKRKQILLHMWHLSCWSYKFKPGDKSSVVTFEEMRTGL